MFAAEFAAVLARREDLASVRRQLVTRMLSARQRLQLAMAFVCSSLDATIAGRLNRRETVALVGAASRANDPGDSKGRRCA